MSVRTSTCTVGADYMPRRTVASSFSQRSSSSQRYLQGNVYAPRIPHLSTPHVSTPHISTQSLFKRAVDIAGSLVGLTILGILFLPIAIAIRLDSPGPIFYSQLRFGLQGKPFRIWKFRSMVSNADALRASVVSAAKCPLMFKQVNDPRITRVGRFLRKTSLDEFPQFWNVLKGEMSLVGTRPPIEEEVAKYSDRHWRRLDVRPGLTGQWQVSGRSKIDDFERVVTLDLYYQRRWSRRYDLIILVRTVGRVFSKDSGAF